MKNQNELPAHRQGEDGDRRAEDERRVETEESEAEALRKILATNITEQRKRLKLSRAALADKVGVTEAAIGQYERAERLPSIITLKKLTAVFQTTIDSLVGNRDLEWWVAIRFLEKLGLIVADEDDQFKSLNEKYAPETVKIYSETDRLSCFKDNYEDEVEFELNSGFFPIYRPDRDFIGFVDSDDIVFFADLMADILCHVNGAKYYANKFLLAFLEKKGLAIPELLLIDRSSVTSQIYVTKKKLTD